MRKFRKTDKNFKQIILFTYQKGQYTWKISSKCDSQMLAREKGFYFYHKHNKNINLAQLRDSISCNSGLTYNIGL